MAAHFADSLAQGSGNPCGGSGRTGKGGEDPCLGCSPCAAGWRGRQEPAPQKFSEGPESIQCNPHAWQPELTPPSRHAGCRASAWLCLASALSGIVATPASAVASAAGSKARGPECWTHGFTRGQCCNAMHGRRGNERCWDAGDFTFEHCCDGRLYEPRGCQAFITHFGFDAVGFGTDAKTIGESWTQCATSMERRRGHCNSLNSTQRSCPECALLSEHLPTYIRCIRQEQDRAVPLASCPACCAGKGNSSSVAEDDGGGTETLVGGVHYPTLLRPRSEGRDFTFMASAFDMTVGSQLISEGKWMPQEIRLLEGLLPRGGVVVDAGANIGGFTVPLAKHVGPDGQVHAFEPFRNIFQLLTANCALNGLLSCFTYQNALGAAAEKRSRRSPGLNAVGNPSKSYVVEQIASELLVHHDGDGRTEIVEVVALDERLHLSRLDIIKIDVESSEYEMLQGSERTIRQHQPVIYVEDSEADMMNLHSPTKVMRLLSERHAYECVNLAQSGLVSMTSLLCAPQAVVQEVLARVMQIDWRLTT